jgi:uncharacterized protein (DUF1499 family)
VKKRRLAMHLVIWLALVVLAVLVAARFGAFSGRAPTNLGVADGKLKPPSKTPNSVTSQADLWPDATQREYARIAPIAVVGNDSGDGKATIAKMAQVIEDLPGAHIVERRDDYLYVQFTTSMLRFVDDVEFWFDPAAGVVQVRSASRVGRKDFGVNRARVENIRARLGA